MTSLDTPPGSLHETAHEQNDNWAWSETLTQSIASKLTGHSLKVCTGLRPICDVNLDIKSLHSIADSPDAQFDTTRILPGDTTLDTYTDKLNVDTSSDTIYGRIRSDSHPDLYNGFACHGDMFDIPFTSDSFDTVVSDPPWLSISKHDRKSLFNEVLRVAKPGGLIIYNSTWIPEEELAHRTDLKFRQQLDFWGGPSFIAFYNTQPDTVYDLPNLASTLSPTTYTFQHSQYTTGVDPRLTDSTQTEYHCPKCDCTTLQPVQHNGNSLHFDAPVLYECTDCAFRPILSEVYENALSELPTAERWMFPSTYTFADELFDNSQTTIDDWHTTTSQPTPQ